MRNMFMAWVGRVAILIDSLQDLQLVVVLVRMLCDYDFDRHICLVPDRHVSEGRLERDSASYSSS